MSEVKKAWFGKEPCLNEQEVRILEAFLKLSRNGSYPPAAAEGPYSDYEDSEEGEFSENEIAIINVLLNQE